jgi:hypothetical protein
MTRRPVYVPGQSAPASGTYEQINVFGSPTGIRVDVAHGQPLPAVPVGYGWRIAENDAEKNAGADGELRPCATSAEATASAP